MLEAGVGHHGVEASEALPAGLDGAAVAIARGQIGVVGLAGTVGVGLEVDGQHPGASVYEPAGDGPADTAGRTRHQHAAAVQVVHASPYTLVRP